MAVSRFTVAAFPERTREPVLALICIPASVAVTVAGIPASVIAPVFAVILVSRDTVEVLPERTRLPALAVIVVSRLTVA